MPFLFERIDDETELLLPDNLLHSDSLIRKLVSEIDEEDWQEVEIIGWLYQFYISEKKDEVIGKVVASEDIPAATQLFTPNWIVKYLVQNTLGRQWLATYPQSPLSSRWSITSSRPSRRPKCRTTQGDHADQPEPRRTHADRPGVWLWPHPGGSLRPVQSHLPGAGLPGEDIPPLILERTSSAWRSTTERRSSPASP